MPKIEVKPGRARVSLKIWTSTMSIDTAGVRMSEEAAVSIYKIALNGNLESAIPKGFKLVPVEPESPAAATPSDGA